MTEVFAATAAAPAEHGQKAPDKAFLYSGINFILLVVLLYFLLKKPVKAFFDNRALKIKARLAEAAKRHDEARRQFDGIEGRLKRVETETESLIRAFKTEALQEKARMMKDARLSAEKMVEESARIAAYEVQKARQAIKEETVRLCEEIVRGKIKKEMTEEDMKKLGSRSVLEVQQLGVK